MAMVSRSPKAQNVYFTSKGHSVTSQFCSPLASLTCETTNPQRIQIVYFTSKSCSVNNEFCSPLTSFLVNYKSWYQQDNPQIRVSNDKLNHRLGLETTTQRRIG